MDFGDLDSTAAHDTARATAMTAHPSSRMSIVCSGGKASTCNDSNGATPESRNSREDTYPDSMAPVPSEHRAATAAMSPVSMASCATIRILSMPRARSVPISWMRERIQKTSAIASTSTSARQTDSSTMRTRLRTVCTDCRTPESRAESSVTSYLPPAMVLARPIAADRSCGLSDRHRIMSIRSFPVRAEATRLPE